MRPYCSMYPHSEFSFIILGKEYQRLEKTNQIYAFLFIAHRNGRKGQRIRQNIES